MVRYSIITACLNSAGTLERTIKSVFSQVVLPSEFIFVDGGSSDNTLQIIQNAIAFAEVRRLPIKFKVLHQKTKGGIYEAWNLALREATAEIICLLSSDDWYYADTMSYVLNCFTEDPTAEIVLGAGLYVEDSQLRNGKVCATRPFFIFPFAMTVIHPACFVKRSVYERLGGFDDKYRVAGDYEFTYRCYKEGVKFLKTTRVLVKVQTGGFSERNTDIARVEVAEIGERYASLKFLPRAANLVRRGLRKWSA